MLIDGKLVDADSGKTFDNINPATEEVLGQVADASTAEMQRPSTPPGGPSTRPTGRPTTPCASVPRAAARGAAGRAGGAARGADPRGRLPADDHERAAARRAAGRRAAWPAKQIDEFEWETRAARRHRASGLARRARGSGRSPSASSGAIVPWNFPFEVTSTRSARRWPPATRWCSSPRPTRRGTPRPRPAHRREDRHPGRASSTSSRRRTTSSARSSRCRRRST